MAREYQSEGRLICLNASFLFFMSLVLCWMVKYLGVRNDLVLIILFGFITIIFIGNFLLLIGFLTENYCLLTTWQAIIITTFLATGFFIGVFIFAGVHQEDFAPVALIMFGVGMMIIVPLYKINSIINELRSSREEADKLQANKELFINQEEYEPNTCEVDKRLGPVHAVDPDLPGPPPAYSDAVGLKVDTVVTWVKEVTPSFFGK